MIFSPSFICGLVILLATLLSTCDSPNAPSLTSYDVVVTNEVPVAAPATSTTTPWSDVIQNIISSYLPTISQVALTLLAIPIAMYLSRIYQQQQQQEEDVQQTLVVYDKDAYALVVYKRIKNHQQQQQQEEDVQQTVNKDTALVVYDKDAYALIVYKRIKNHQQQQQEDVQQTVNKDTALVVYDKDAYALIVYKCIKNQVPSSPPPAAATASSSSVPDFSSRIPTFGANTTRTRPTEATPQRSNPFSFGAGNSSTTSAGGTFKFGSSSGTTSNNNDAPANNANRSSTRRRRRGGGGGGGTTTKKKGTKRNHASSSCSSTRDPRCSTMEYQIAIEACQEILKLPNVGTTPSQVASLFRRISLKYHPDKNVGNDPKLASAVFREIIRIKDEKLANLL